LVLSPVARIVSWSRRHRVLVAVGTLCLAAASLFGLRRLTFDADVLSLLPRDGETIPAFRSFVDRFGSLDQLYVVFTAPEGYSAADYEEVIQTWIDRLREAGEITRVDTGLADRSRDLTWLSDRQLLLLDDDALEEALRRFRPAGMRKALAERRELLTMPSPAIADLVRTDPLGLYELLGRQLGGSQSGMNIGFSPSGYVSADGRSRMVIAMPAHPPYNTDFSRALFSRLESLRAELSQTPAGEPTEEPQPPLSVEFAGGHRIALETEALVRRESIMNTIGSLALVLPLLWFVFRSLWLVGVGPLPSLASLLLVLGLLGLAGATLSAAATASAAMLFGLGVDGVVLLYVAYTLSLADGAAPDAAATGLAGPASSMLLGMWTTAATFYGLAWVDFPSLEQLGQLIGHSMVLCGIFTLVLVPALLPRRRPTRSIRPLTMPGLAGWVQGRRHLILALALGLTLLLGAAATRLRVNPTLEKLRSVTSGAQLQEKIGPMFGLPGDVQVVLAEGADLDSLLTANEQLAERIKSELPDVPVQAASTLLPSGATQDARASTLQSATLSPASVGETLTQAAEIEGFRQDSFDPFRERLPAMLDPAQRLTSQGFVDHGLGDLIGRFVARRGDVWLLATYVFPESEAQTARLEEIVRSSDAGGTLTGISFVNRELANRFVPQFVKGLAIGSLVVLVLVVLAFRDWWLSMLSLIPTIIGLVWAAGVLALLRIELDLFAIFAVVTFVGIGVDYGIHLVHRFRERGDAQRAIAELAPVILVAAAITLFGYGTLVTSSYPPLRSIGLVSVVSVITLAVASVLVLPAMLSSARGGRPM
jgi:uncharacterized protein